MPNELEGVVQGDPNQIPQFQMAMVFDKSIFNPCNFFREIANVDFGHPVIKGLRILYTIAHLVLTKQKYDDTFIIGCTKITMNCSLEANHKKHDQFLIVTSKPKYFSKYYDSS